MSATQVAFVAPILSLVGVALAAWFGIRLERRQRLLQARQAAYARVVSTLELTRQHLLVEDMFAGQLDALRQVGDRRAGGFDLADTVRALEARRDRVLDHVLRPLLEAEAEVQLFGSPAVHRATRQVSDLVTELLHPDRESFDSARYDAALAALRQTIRQELRVRGR